MKAEALLFIIWWFIETRRLSGMVISHHAIFTRLWKNAHEENFTETRRKSSSRNVPRIDDLDLQSALNSRPIFCSMSFSATCCIRGLIKYEDNSPSALNDPYFLLFPPQGHMDWHVVFDRHCRVDGSASGRRRCLTVSA